MNAWPKLQNNAFFLTHFANQVNLKVIGGYITSFETRLFKS